ncbi:MAG: hypothetical protein KIT58_21835, partial [Planctomycetota bacterium]|nr:hypothetical protein [Planctomycetota bacterium]
MSAPVPIMVVSDGPRDAAMLPPLVSTILGAEVQAVASRAWSSVVLRRGGGYDRKLRFVLREALDQGARGVVATVDRDRAPRRSRLADLVAGRDAERQDPRSPVAQLPTALGEADPHAEAWLLDDPKAVRAALGLDGRAEVPNVRRSSPKDALDALFAGSDERPLDLLAAVAREVDPGRCAHARETGLEAFCAEVRRELGPLAAAPG